MDCLVLGDSIAVGLAAASHCRSVAKVGISSPAYTKAHVSFPRAGVTVISLGSNDAGACACLKTLRSRISGAVVWILPLNNPNARSLIHSVAAAHGDRVVGFSDSNDGVHPRSYSALGKKVF